MAQVSAIPVNSLLSSLPLPEREQLLSMLEAVPMPVRTGLFRPGERPQHVHFMTSGLASIVTEMSVGEGVEVGLIGREGVPEFLHLLGPEMGLSQCFVQMEGSALRMPFVKFQKLFLDNEAIRASILRFVQYESLVVTQLAACNRLHGVGERLARWLLMVADRTGMIDFVLTQEFLAEMLGARRSTVTLTAGALQASGLIHYRRGVIQILDRERLTEVACECYEVTHRLLQSLRL